MSKYQEIGDRLRQLRGPMSQAAFAKKIGTSFRAYQYYEKGDRVPKGDVLHRIASICRIPADWILSGKEKIQTKEDVKEEIRHHLYIEKIDYTEADVEALVPRWLQSSRAAEAPAVYRLDTIEEKIVKLLEEMSEEEKRAVLKYVQAQKRLVDELKKKEE